MARDRVLPTAVYDGGAPVQAFPLGGKAYPMPVSGDVLSGFPAATSGAASLFLFDVPPDTILYVGRAQDLAGLTVAQARARMFPLRQVSTFACTDDAQADVRFLAEAGVAALDVRVLEAANLGGAA